MSFQQTIFLIDRDVAANELLARNFEAHEFMVHTATTAEELLQMVRTKRADLIILGVDLPDMDGRDACRLLRKRGLLTPVLIVSDAASDADTILGLDSGANDYIVKPVKFPSLLARVRAHLRTSEANSNAAIRIGLCEFQPADRVIVGADRSHIQLTEKETQVLRYLFRARGRPVSKQELLVEVWGYSSKVNSHTVETHVYRLRQKIERLSLAGCVLRTEDKGYSLLSSIPDRADVPRVRIVSSQEQGSLIRAAALHAAESKAAISSVG
ncbi:MAG TPA: response regulator transcription factor [Hyphomonadaceae bacterium]|nr:response regulator transcription factor [Hyphomonadaceae bacterium]